MTEMSQKGSITVAFCSPKNLDLQHPQGTWDAFQS